MLCRRLVGFYALWSVMNVLTGLTSHKYGYEITSEDSGTHYIIDLDFEFISGESAMV